MGEAGGVSLPELEEENGPEAHKHREGHSELIVEEDLVSGHVASLLQPPEVTRVAHRTHDSITHVASANVT